MKKILWAFLFIAFTAASASAHPPTDMKLEYDAQQKILKVTMRHVTTDVRVHYVRAITVTVNQQDPQVFHYTHQDHASFVDVSLAIDAKPGDTIHVKATSLQGGSEEGDLQVPQEEEKEKKSP